MSGDLPDMNNTFDPSCRRCPRLAAFLDEVRVEVEADDEFEDD